MDVQLLSIVCCVSIASRSPCPVCIHSSATRALYFGANVWGDAVDTCVQAHH